MKKFPLINALLIVCVSISYAQKSGTTALSVLAKNSPDVRWNEKSQIKGDFDYDGVVDYALRGRRGKYFVLGIVKGAMSGKSKFWTMQFGEDAGDQGSLCSVKSAVITIDDIDKDYFEFAGDYLEADYAIRLKNLPKNSKGITVADGMCDSFHVFWDKKAKQFTWWRI